MSESTKVVEVYVGHSSHRLSNVTHGHTHQWTLFVKPANKEYENFLDNKLIQKVVFEIHESFKNPMRTLTKPPFKITETGFASFPAFVHIYLNLPNQKPRTIPYELVLFTGESDNQECLQKLVVREDKMSSEFLDEVKKYGKSKKRKASLMSSHSDKSSKSPQERKKRELKLEPVLEDSWKTNGKKLKSSKESDKDIPKIKVTGLGEPPRQKDLRDKVDSRRDKTKLTTKSPERRRPRSAEEVTKKIRKISDPNVMYKVSEYLLTMPMTTINKTTLTLSFDLSQSSPEHLDEIIMIMKSAKTSKSPS